MEEMLTVARTLRIPLHISHLKAMGRDSWGKRIPRALALLEQARQEGEENLLAQLQSLLPEGSRVDETHFAAARQGDTLLVTLRAVCTEQIGRPVVLENPAG